MNNQQDFDGENESILEEIYAFKEEFFNHQFAKMKVKGLSYFQDRYEMDKLQHLSYAYDALIYFMNENQLKKQEYVRALINLLISSFPNAISIEYAEEQLCLMQQFGLDYFLKRKEGEELYYLSCAYEILICYMQEEQYEKCCYIRTLIASLKSYFPSVLTHIIVDNKVKKVVTYTKRK